MTSYVITVRVEEELYDTIVSLAKRDEITIANAIKKKLACIHAIECQLAIDFERELSDMVKSKCSVEDIDCLVSRYKSMALPKDIGNAIYNKIVK